MSSFCSDAARHRGDAIVGTAPPATRWLLLEQDSGWVADVQGSVQAPPDALRSLDRALARASARLELIRRPGVRTAAEQRHRWAVLDAKLGVEVWGERDADGGWGGALEALADPLAHGANTGPGVLLVCTHGKHDACCAVRGRPVAAVLAERWPDLTWECTHLGGDRFAANLAVMPDGVLYGYVDAADAVALVTAHRARTPDLTRLRGVVGRDPNEQAALIAVAAHFEEAPWDRRLTVTREASGRSWRVQVRMGERRVEVRGHDLLAEPARLTCAAPGARSALVPVVDAVRPL